jgi:hypothetical protein
LEAANAGFNASFILGGQIGSEPPPLFHIYPEGNFIEATDDTPYFQIGEHKYGRSGGAAWHAARRGGQAGAAVIRLYPAIEPFGWAGD